MNTMPAMADYINKNILCQAYIHVDLPDGITIAQLDEIKAHLSEFATSRAKFFVYPDVDVAVEFSDGSLKAKVSIFGMIYLAVIGYGDFRNGVDYLHTDVKRLADSVVAESLFMTRARHESIIRTEARTGVVGSLKILVDDMNTLDGSIGQIPVEEVARRINKIKADADVLLANVRSEEDSKNIEEELGIFSDNLPERCPYPKHRNPESAAIIEYNDALVEFRKSFGRIKKATKKVSPPPFVP